MINANGPLKTINCPKNLLIIFLKSTCKNSVNRLTMEIPNELKTIFPTKKLSTIDKYRYKKTLKDVFFRKHDSSLYRKYEI